MEDAEKIILEHLKQVGCDFDVETLKDFDAEMTLEAVVKCLKVIIVDFSAPTVVPHNMVAKYNIGMKLADALVSLGFKGELGYQSFLYSNEIELRRIFSFLIEKLPKEDKSSPIQAGGGNTFRKDFAAALKAELQRPWLPAVVRDDYKTVAFQPIGVSSGDDLLLIKDRSTLIASVLQTNALLRADIALSSDECVRFSDVVQPDRIAKEPSTAEDVQSVGEEESSAEAEAEAEKVEEQPDEVEILEGRNVQLSEQLDAVDGEFGELTNEFTNVQERLEELESILKQEKHSGKIRLKANELIEERGPDGAVNFCNEYLDQLQTKSAKLAVEWEEHRRPLLESIRELRNENAAKWNQQTNRRERILRLEREKQRLIKEFTFKKELVKQLQAECDNQKEANVTQRSSYLSRIREIVSSVSRQRDDIDKVLLENRKKQREMNLLADRLERSFAAAEQFFAKQAMKMEDAKKMHRHIAEIHRDCKTIFEAVEGNGAIQREIRDLEERIEKERESKIEENLIRITADFNQMKLENDAIQTELTKKGVILN